MRKTILKFAAIALSTVLCLTLAAPCLAYGDVVDPYSTDFVDVYRKHINSLDRFFICKSETGSSKIMSDPTDLDMLGEVANGETVFLCYSCLYDGEFWGYLYEPQNENLESDVTGWVKISDFLVYYDYIAFQEDHQDEFFEYTGDYSEFERVDKALIWTWPRSGQYIASVEARKSNALRNEKPPFDFAYCYRDTDGMEWGFISASGPRSHIFNIEHSSYWICISDPNNRELSALNSKEPYLWQSDTTHTDIATARDNILEASSKIATLIPVIVLVAAVVISTVVVIAVMFRIKRA